MNAAFARVLALAATLALVSCDVLATRPAASPMASQATAQPSPSVSSLPRADEERAIVAVLTNAGFRFDRVSQSKFDWLLRDAAPRTGIFQGYADGKQVWADVHFLDRPVAGVTVCTEQPPASEWTFTVSVQGQPQALGGSRGTGAATSPLYFAMNDRYFVMASDMRVRDALRSALGLSVPVCREPATLPVFPWERDVIDAVTVAGAEVRLVGGSKWESFLGERREARHFGWTRGQTDGGAEVIYLEEPLRELRMCSAPSAPGYTTWSIRVNGQGLAGIEEEPDRECVGSRTWAQCAALLIRTATTSAAPRAASRTPDRPRTSS